MLALTSPCQKHHLARLSRNVALSLEKIRPHIYRLPRVTGLWIASTTKREYHLSSGVSNRIRQLTKREYHLSLGVSSRIRRHDIRWVPFLVASATATSAASTSKTAMANYSHTFCSNAGAQRGSASTRSRRYLPPPVGISTREFSSSSTVNTATTATTANSTGGNENDNEALPSSYSANCPLCAKYSAGPCGTLFRQWLACTDNAAATTNDKDRGGDVDHVALCAQDFDRLQACLEKHSDYYDKIRVGVDDSPGAGTKNDDNDDDDSTRASGVQQAWEAMIQEELAGAATESFPEALRPMVRIRPKSGQATASFAVSSSSSKGVVNFVLAFVRTTSKDNEADGNGDDGDAYTLLAAGAKEDLYIDADADDRIVLAFRVPTASAAIIVSAVYEQQDDSVAVYEYRVNDGAVDSADERS
jgi:hypothetical protein